MCLGIPGLILSAAGEGLGRTARVSFGGVVKDVSLAYVPEAEPGDHVIVHVGFAISRVDEDEAAKIFEYLRTLGELRDLGAAP